MTKKIKDVEILSMFDYDELPAIRHAPKRWRLKGDLIVKYKNKKVIIPKGFIWDGSSVPGFLSWYTQRDEHLLASCIHDFLYLTHKVQVKDGIDIVWYNVTKSYADAIFREIISDIYRERYTKALVIWCAVHTMGYYFWYNNTCDFQCEFMKNFCLQQKMGNCPLLDFVDEMKTAKGLLK